MKKYIPHTTLLFAFSAMFVGSPTLHAQKDTLHLYYQSIETAVLDSNDLKIGNWAKSLKGQKTEVEIFTYYDNSEFRKYMLERAENVNRIVIRKARDFTTIKYSGAIKGKKWQRTMADIVYTTNRPPIAQPTVTVDAGKTPMEDKKTESVKPHAITTTLPETSVPSEDEDIKKEETVATPQNTTTPDANRSAASDSVRVKDVPVIKSKKNKKK